MTRFKKWEKLFFAVLCALSLLACLVCIPFRGARFGVLIFALFAVCTGGMWFCLKTRENRGKFAALASILANIGRILFLLWLISFIIIEICIWWVGARTDTKASNADYLLVLGAGLYGETPSAALQNRLIAAQEYLTEYPESRAVLCGGQGSQETIPEAVAMYRWLTAHGIAKERLILEDSSVNTLENIAHAKTILDNLAPSRQYRSAVLSNEFHLFRARKLMQKAGLEPYGVSAPTPYFGLRIIYGIREYFSIAGLLLSGQWVR